MQKLNVNLWMSGTGGEAAAFYADALPDATTQVVARYPTEGLLEFQKPLAGEPLTLWVTVRGQKFTLINAGEDFTPNPSISLMLNFDPLDYDGNLEAAKADLDATWSKLSQGGGVLMELGEYPYSARYGWVQDKYNVSWQLILSDQEGDRRPFLMPTLLFGGAAQNRAGEAIDYYEDVFGARAGMLVAYDEPTEAASAGAVMFADFALEDDWVSVMDSAVPQPFTFGPGVSLEWPCDGQAELDRLWDALTAVPEAEQCGWLTDKFGVSWQIVPSNMDELMSRPNAFEHLMAMKKLVIDEF
ncbi:hypothetical protein CQ018_16810 [Arthrobacter sp. MYb227]|uniref:VOC family protein n=1 Tax=Arthrobacter sp. MYb227 TaxID=1848601 RepID=UPI000CFC50FD|nr:VOC family protein [Arthrobacter sp. MYb227]PQZ88111.1 hypothetical protein CQ018_16810 [Arthrobacter sp. MYb227]